MKEYSDTKREFADPLMAKQNIQFSYISHSAEAALSRTSSSIVVNQVSPGISMIAHTYLPFETECPFCKKEITTDAIQTFNCGTCFLCYSTGFCLFCCIQICREKDICCYDAVHRCPYCRKTIAVYNSC